jgi:hypothetical protein
MSRSRSSRWIGSTLNGYVPNLQVSEQVVSFLVAHRSNPVPLPTLFAKIGERFRAAVKVFAAEDDVPVIRLSPRCWG